MEDKEYKTSAQQREYVKRYLSKFVDIKIRVTAEERDAINSHALAMGESTSAFIKRAIRDAVAKDSKKLLDK